MIKRCRLEEIIKERGLKQNYLADKFEVTDATITDWKKGKRAPNVYEAIRVAKLLGLQVEDIWYTED